MIKKIKLFYKNIDDDLIDSIKDKFSQNGFEIVQNDFELGIAIGGDGAFLHMIKSCNFDCNYYYVGINSGTLGFLQEIKLEEIDNFIKELKDNLFKEETIGIQNTTIITDDKTYNYNSLNEIVIYDGNLKMLKMDVLIENDLLENYVGDGMLISTSSGSTAHNLSFRGSIVYNTFSSLQLTPIAPINSKVYRALTNSVIIPDNMLITLKPSNTKNILLIIDGVNYYIENVKEIRTIISNKKIKMLRFSNYNFSQKIKEKLLG